MRTFVAVYLAALCLNYKIDRVCSRASTNETCAICNTNIDYTNDGKGGCVTRFSEGCLFADESGQCLRCRSGVPRGAICYQQDPIPNCAKYNADMTCAYCHSPYYFDGEKCSAVTQKEPTDKCALYSDSTTCAVCVGGYVLRNNVCQKAINNCLVQAGINCMSCVQNSYSTTPSAPRLPFDETFWRVYASMSPAAYGLPDISGVQSSTSVSCTPNTDANCLVSSSPTLCAVCATGYYPGVNGKCVSVGLGGLVNNCLVYAAPGICTQCLAGSYPTPHLGITSCVSNPVTQTVQNCLYYSGVSTCSRCLPGYYLNSGVCTAVPTVIVGCEIYDTVSTCQHCLASYYVSSSTCLPMSGQIVAGCAAYDNTGCTACQAGYVPGSSPVTCTAISSGSLVANCARYSSAPTCTECIPTAFMDSNRCYLMSDPACRYVMSDGRCGECNSSHYLDRSIQMCIALPSSFTTVTSCISYDDSTGSVECALCASPSPTLDTNNYTCVAAPSSPNPNVASCTNYRLDNTVYDCLRCPGGRSLDPTNGCISVTTSIDECAVYGRGGANATTCDFCYSGYITNNAETVCNRYPTIPNCVVRSAYSTCTVCNDTSFLNGNACTVIPVANRIASCKRYSSASVCTECGIAAGQQYYLDNNTCLPLTVPLPNCKYHDTLYTCQICNPQYEVSNGVCVPVAAVANCAEYSSGACTMCNANYYLNGAACSPLTGISGCVRYASASVCAVCDNQSYLSSGACLSIIGSPVASCVEYDSATTCRICDIGYALAPNKQLCINNCDRADETGCVECTGDFYSNAGTCTAISAAIPNCRYYSGATQCEQCVAGYLLEGNVCTSILGADHCEYLTEQTSCALCMPGYKSSGNGCVAINTSGSNTIPGCLIYAVDLKTCDVCDKNYHQTTPGGPCICNDSYLTAN